jgi:hypothetical protein
VPLEGKNHNSLRFEVEPTLPLFRFGVKAAYWTNFPFEERNRAELFNQLVLFHFLWGKLSGKRSENGLAPHPGFSRRSRALHGRFSRLRIVSLFNPHEMEENLFIKYVGLTLLPFLEFGKSKRSKGVRNTSLTGQTFSVPLDSRGGRGINITN